MPDQRFSSGEKTRKAGGGQNPRDHGEVGAGEPSLPGTNTSDELRVGAPDYIAKLGNAFASCPPGHRFRLYFAGWQQDWQLTRNRRPEVLQALTTLRKGVKELMEQVVARQKAAAQGNEFLLLSCVTTSPFTTGLGNEHPLENGFAFLDPYGLPYLPGSAVKGVVRRAAEELALFEDDPRGWSLPAIWWLFGFDAQSAFFRTPKGNEAIKKEIDRWRQAYRKKITQLPPEEKSLFEELCRLVANNMHTSKKNETQISSELLQDSESSENKRDVLGHVHVKGATHFFDVIPICSKGLKVDIMNPHYGHYYQGDEPPGDWGNPVPIFFLTLPVGSEFNFLIRFAPPLSWPMHVRKYFEDGVAGKPRWKTLLESAFSFAWEWQGFGAKTSTGYGRFAAGQSTATPQLAGLADAPAGKVVSPATVSPRLAGIAERLASGGPLSREEIQAMVNEICKSYREEYAVVVAKKLWEIVGVNAYFARLLASNRIFKDLLAREGIGL